MGPRWKGKGSEAKALTEPMSQIVSELHTSLTQSEARGLLSGSNVLLRLGPDQADSLNRACFGVPITTSEKNHLWFQLGFEEAFYLCHALKCLDIVDQSKSSLDEAELWRYMKSQRGNFPEFYKAYTHLRAKNWVVTSGVRYGADFVAYRHHPALVHSEFAVLVSPGGGGGIGGDPRLGVWSDVHCAARLCRGVVKMLLIVDVARNGCGDDSAASLEGYEVVERAITRWLPERCREERSNSNSDSKE